MGKRKENQRKKSKNQTRRKVNKNTKETNEKMEKEKLFGYTNLSIILIYSQLNNSNYLLKHVSISCRNDISMLLNVLLLSPYIYTPNTAFHVFYSLTFSQDVVKVVHVIFCKFCYSLHSL